MNRLINYFLDLLTKNSKTVPAYDIDSELNIAADLPPSTSDSGQNSAEGYSPTNRSDQVSNYACVDLENSDRHNSLVEEVDFDDQSVTIEAEPTNTTIDELMEHLPEQLQEGNLNEYVPTSQ